MDRNNTPLVAGDCRAMSTASNNYGCGDFIVILAMLVLLFFINDKLSEIRDEIKEQRKQQEIQQFNQQLKLWKTYKVEEVPK